MNETAIFYRELLKKYINHVEECEGTNFIGSISVGYNSISDLCFSEEELNILKRLEE